MEEEVEAADVREGACGESDTALSQTHASSPRRGSPPGSRGSRGYLHRERTVEERGPYRAGTLHCIPAVL